MVADVMLVGGTRPEAIKLAPLLLAARDRSRPPLRLIATGQHGARFDAALAEFDLAPDLRLPPIAFGACPDAAIRAIKAALLPLLARDPPALLLVQGDTSSAVAGAEVAARLGIPLGHVEAGLRSGDLDRPWPEERNRVRIDALADLLFAPTAAAAAALRREPAVRGAIHVTGNTGIDALLWMRERVPPAPPPPPGAPHRLLLTCHRRESIGAGIAAICAAARRLADRDDVHMLCPVHGNPAVGDAVRAALSDHSAITLVEGLRYRDTVAAMAAATLILSDSGGIQEEAPALGTPVLVLRDTTERQEGLASGLLRLVGTDPDRIVAEAARLLDDPVARAAIARPAFPFGRGDAAGRILDVVEAYVPKRPLRLLPLPKPAISPKDAPEKECDYGLGPR